MSSRIEQIIEEIEEYIDSCKFQPLSTSKIIVNKDQMDELLRELRMKTSTECPLLMMNLSRSGSSAFSGLIFICTFGEGIPAPQGIKVCFSF